MPSMKMLRRRLASVTTTKKIMKAMNMVAASKLQKNRHRLEHARPFFNDVWKTMESLKTDERVSDNIFLTPRPVKNTAYLVVTGDRGLCGSFNINAAEHALNHMNASPASTDIIAVGLKGRSYFQRHGKHILMGYDDVLETAFYEDAERISRYLAELYASGGADEIYVAYTQLKSVLVHVPRVVKILPVANNPGDPAAANEMSYEPDLPVFLDHAIPMYLSAAVYFALLESSACEQAARMVSMDTAEKNASDIIDKLTRVYNRRRQASITQELSEVAGGTNLLNDTER
ncbi:MAG: ATP synthase F1 subunit gamma [Oscillospiraceae bacterium]|nr:ATP synthase F1 subunit gamma [Oscillospiraceae bacterium]